MAIFVSRIKDITQIFVFFLYCLHCLHLVLMSVLFVLSAIRDMVSQFSWLSNVSGIIFVVLATVRGVCWVWNNKVIRCDLFWDYISSLRVDFAIVSKFSNCTICIQVDLRKYYLWIVVLTWSSFFLSMEKNRIEYTLCILLRYMYFFNYWSTCWFLFCISQSNILNQALQYYREVSKLKWMTSCDHNTQRSSIKKDHPKSKTNQ